MVEVDGSNHVGTHPSRTPLEVLGERDWQLNGTSERTPHQTTNVDIEPPDGGYGWICVACYFLINAHTWGINSVSLL